MGCHLGPIQAKKGEVMRPKIYQRDDGFFVILDQRETPFGYALFSSEDHAMMAWDWYVEALRDAALYSEHHPDNH